MTLDELQQLGEKLKDEAAERQRLTLAVLALQQCMGEILQHIAGQGPAIAAAITAGFAAAKPPQVSFTAPAPNVMLPAPAPRAALPAIDVDTHPDGRIKRLTFVQPTAH